MKLCAEALCPSPAFGSPPLEPLWYDLTVTTTVMTCGRWILQGLEKLNSWARMGFKPTKSRAMVFKREKGVDKFCFFLDGIVIPFILRDQSRALARSLTVASGMQFKQPSRRHGSPQ